MAIDRIALVSLLCSIVLLSEIIPALLTRFVCLSFNSGRRTARIVLRVLCLEFGDEAARLEELFLVHFVLAI